MTDGNASQAKAKGPVRPWILVLFVVAVAAYFVVGPGKERASVVARAVDPYASTADQFVRQYEIVKKNGGGVIELCNAAGLAEAGFLQAGDAANHKKWLEIKRQHCAPLGMP